MTCLTDEQLLVTALGKPGFDEPCVAPAVLTHIRGCSECTVRLRELELQFDRLAVAHGAFDLGHAESRERLLAAMQNRPVEQVRLSWLGRFYLSKEGRLMHRRVVISGVVAASVAFVVTMVLSGLSPASALAQTAAALRKVKSYECQVTIVGSAKSGAKKKETGTLYWAAPGSIRQEMREDGKLVSVRIVLAGKPGMEIDHKLENYRRLEPAVGKQSPLYLLGELAKFQGEADRKLGDERIDGKAARGFEVTIAKVDPDAGDGTIQVWTDPNTSLPVKVVVESQGVKGTLEAFQWDRVTDKRFDMVPPAKYSDKTGTAPDEKIQTKEIVKALKIYAKYCGGKYPQVATLYPDVALAELRRSLGVGWPPTKQQVDSGAYDTVQQAQQGLSSIFGIQRHNSDAAYNGKTVGPEDKEKVLLRWKLGAGNYQVIYGDLRADTVTAVRLKEIEKR